MMASSKGPIRAAVRMGVFAFVLAATYAWGADYAFDYEIWGRASYGDGYIYGVPLRTTGVTVADYDSDGDNDFILPGLRSEIQVMRNLGNDRAFYPGGPRNLSVPLPDPFAAFNVFMEMADVNGDIRPDLIVVLDNINTGYSSIVLYLNNPASPRDNPTYTLDATVYESSQLGYTTIGPVNLADIDADGDLDLFFIEYFVSDATRPHRLFRMLNTGNAMSPFWDTPAENAHLSNLMPPLQEYKSGEREKLAMWSGPGNFVDQSKATAGPRVSDFQMADWDLDGDLDFMFYDIQRGVDWVLNEGAPDSPAWDDVINRDIRPYGQPDNLGLIEGSFAIKPAPFSPDFYVSIQGRLQGWRYNRALGGYELIQRSAVAYSFGQGLPAFWDFDGDGDLDMFRQGINAFDQQAMLLFPNVGAPYAPIWGESYTQLPAIQLHGGSPANQYRQDLPIFFDADLDGYQEFFVQRQNGGISYYETVQGAFPLFLLNTDNLAGLTSIYTDEGLTGIQPRGIAFADFNGYYDINQGQFVAFAPDLLVAVATDDGGRLFFLTQVHDPNTPGIDYFDVYYDVTNALLDENENLLSPNSIESFAAADVTRDGRPDLIVVRSSDENYLSCDLLLYENVQTSESGQWGFDFKEILPAPAATDPYQARMIALADIDSDTDADLFIGHQVYNASDPDPVTNRYPYLQFYRNSGENFLNFVQTRVVSGQSRRYSVNVPHVYLLNRSGGSLDNAQFRYNAGPVSKVVDVIETTGLAENTRYFIDVLPPVGSESKAVLVVGSTLDDPLYNVFSFLAGQAYLALRLQGLSKDNIRLFAPGPIDGDFDGLSDTFSTTVTPVMLQQSIQNWPQGAQRLLVYLVDHGQRNRFRLNDVDYLEAATYDAWLDALQNTANPPAVTTVIDTCESGSFVDNLALAKSDKKAGKQRITITSAGVGPTRGVALLDSVRGISFSLAFFSELAYGSTYGKAFDIAKIAIESINPLQVPQIDDDGNGTGNQQSDGLLADSHRPGADFEQAASGAFIGDVAPPQSIASDTADLWLSDVVSSFPIDGAGALIVPPNFERDVSLDDDDEQPIGSFEWIDFDFNIANGRWEGTFDKFDEGGLYRIQYYVSSLGRYFASPRVGFVDRVNAPDAWEDDDSFGAANWIRVNSTQGHNFHDLNDRDWVRFFGVAGETATIAALTQGVNCRPIIDIFRKAALDSNPNAAPVRTFTASDYGEDIVGTYTFPQSEVYLARIRNEDGTRFGEGTSYLFVIAVDTGAVIPNTLVAQIVQSGTSSGITGATVQASGAAGPFTSQTTADGIAQFTCPTEGTYTVTVTKSGYQQASQSVLVNNQVEYLTIYMVPTGVSTAQVTLQSDPAGVKALVDGAQYTLPQTFTWQSGSTHAVSVPESLSGGYVWDKWGDGNTSRDRDLTYSSNVTLTATYKNPAAAGDVDGSGAVDAVDVQLVINGALGISVPYNTDVNGDSQVDAVDVQLVINAALGL